MGGFQRARQLAAMAGQAMKGLQFGDGQKMYTDFSGGYISAVSREQVPDNSTPNCLDIEITRNNRIRPAPGTTAVETMAHAVSRLAVHASLDLTAELIALAPPWIGVKGSGATAWTNVGIAADNLAFVNFGGTFVLSDGNKVYLRQPNEAFVATEKIPVSNTYAAFAGRLWTGNCVIDGDMQPLGVSWSDTTSDPESWDTDAGAGFELLINDMASGDEVVALRPMGLDFMAIMCRNSIWVARRTGLEGRPADIQPRVSGTGSLNDKLTVLSRFGIFFVTHLGVHLFDGNSAVLISEAINTDILPLDLANLDKYGLFFDPVRRQLWLFTPTGSWMYEVEKNRWMKRSIVAVDGAMFATQFSAITWADLVGTWGAQTARWKDFRPEEGQSVATLFLSIDRQAMHRLDLSSRNVFGVAMLPYWDTPLTQPERLDELMTTHGVTLEYCGQGSVSILTPGNTSDWQSAVSLSLPNRTVPDVVTKGMTKTGRGVGARIVFRTDSPEILKVQLVYRKRGRRVDTV
ncbi:MAG TPA: hypothetical protein VIY48_07455 [Candidatus Paceibacterota bacterium]